MSMKLHHLYMSTDPFPNDWDEIYNLDESDIESPPFKEVYEDVTTWSLPDPYCCVVRVYNRKEAQLREYAYGCQGVAHQRIKESAEKGYEITVLTDEIIGVINHD